VPHPEDTSIADRIALIRAEIAESARSAGRSPDEITLVAVSKMQSADRVLAAYHAGLRDFGENYVQGLEAHRALLPNDVRWHFIGHLQSKKAKRVCDVALVHSVDSTKLATKLAAAAEQGRPLRVLVNVNISKQESKSGVSPEELLSILRDITPLDGLCVRGLMCIPSPEEEPRQAFARLRELRDTMQTATGIPLPELSMGMSGDFSEAIAEGATIIRVGTRIFGPRNVE